MFGIRELDQWLSWEETKFYANLLDFKTVPELGLKSASTKEAFEQEVHQIIVQPSTFGSVDTFTKETCTMEGVVSRNAAAFAVTDFKHQVFKYVRKGHVKTDQHWSRNWKRAPLIWEQKHNKDVED